MTATFIINRLPTAILGWKSPYELLYDKLPDFDRIRFFGCLCFASNTIPLKDKFAPRAFRCVFLGYATGQKAYKVYDVENERVFTIRDIIFYENEFPFLDFTNSETCPIPIPFLESDTIKSLTDIHIQTEPNSSPNSQNLPYTQNLPNLSNLPNTTTSPIPNVDSSIFPISESSITPHIISPNIPSHSSNTQSISIPTRNSTRPTKPPKWLNDYVCNTFTDSRNSFSLENISFSPDYAAFMANVSKLAEPHSYREVLPNTPNGVQPWIKNYKPWKPMILGKSLNYLKENRLLVLNGSSR